MFSAISVIRETVAKLAVPNRARLKPAVFVGAVALAAVASAAADKYPPDL